MSFRPHRRLATGCLLAGASLLATGASAGDTTVELESVSDNTLIEDDSGAVSGGASREFYVGRVGSNGKNTLRRGVVRDGLDPIRLFSAMRDENRRMNAEFQTG